MERKLGVELKRFLLILLCDDHLVKTLVSLEKVVTLKIINVSKENHNKKFCLEIL